MEVMIVGACSKAKNVNVLYSFSRRLCIPEPQILNGKVEESLTCLSPSLSLLCLFHVLTPFFAAVKMQRSNHLCDRTAKITDINANYGIASTATSTPH